MIREIVRDESFLSLPSAEATKEDLAIAYDLIDTLIANAEGCVGLAANMIGERKRIIAIDNDGEYMIMINPEILKKSAVYETEEGCLSLDGVRKTKRYNSIKVKWLNEKLQPRIKTFEGFTAQIIQHEIDHCNGVII